MKSTNNSEKILISSRSSALNCLKKVNVSILTIHQNIMKSEKKISFTTIVHHRKIKKKELKKELEVVVEAEEGCSYNFSDKVMCLRQRTAQQARSLTPIMELGAKRNLSETYL